MSNDQRLARLQEVAGLMADRALAPVAEATANVRAIEARIAQIAAHRNKLSRATDDPALAGPMLAQAERLRVLQAAALTDLAKARAALDVARKAASKAVGRDQALGKIAERKALTALKEQRRRHLS